MNIKLFNFILTSYCYITCYSHIFMKEPIVRRSKYSSYYLQNNLVDYDIMAPLNVNNYEFPCKGFPKLKPISTITSNSIQVELEAIHGSDKHGGGHCQFGISFNNKNFLVLKQVIRNCVIDSLSYTIDLPNNIPNGELIFFWTWINAIGNREYYMDCADIILSRKNILPTNTPIVGKKLLVVNLPGFRTIPEFPNKNSYDASELLLNVDDTTLFPNPSFSTTTETNDTFQPTTASFTTSSTPPSYTSSITDTTADTTTSSYTSSTTSSSTTFSSITADTTSSSSITNTTTSSIIDTTSSSIIDTTSSSIIDTTSYEQTEYISEYEYSSGQTLFFNIHLLFYIFCIIFYSLF